MNNLDTLLQQFYEHFCTFTDSGVSVSFTSDTLRDEDAMGVTLDDFITKAHNLGLVTGAERMAEETLKKIDGSKFVDPNEAKQFAMHSNGYNQAMEEIEDEVSDIQQQVLNTIKKETLCQ